MSLLEIAKKSANFLLSEAINSRTSISIDVHSIPITHMAESNVENQVVEQEAEEEEVRPYSEPVVIKSSEQSVMRKIFYQDPSIDWSGSLKVGFDVGGVIINTAGTVQHKTEDTTFLKEHLQTPEVYGAISVQFLIFMLVHCI